MMKTQNGSGFGKGLAIGVPIGVMLAMLYAPRSGSRIRVMMAERVLSLTKRPDKLLAWPKKARR